MDRRFQFVTPDTPVWEVQVQMIKFHTFFMVVAEDEKTLVGMVTHGDIFRKMLPSPDELMANPHYRSDPERIEERFRDLLQIPVREIMASDLVTIKADAPIVRAGALMNARGIKQIPVLDAGELIGVVSQFDISESLIRSHAGFVK
jgi:CBS domain-containing protein